MDNKNKSKKIGIIREIERLKNLKEEKIIGDIYVELLKSDTFSKTISETEPNDRSLIIDKKVFDLSKSLNAFILTSDQDFCLKKEEDNRVLYLDAIDELQIYRIESVSHLLKAFKECFGNQPFQVMIPNHKGEKLLSGKIILTTDIPIMNFQLTKF